MNKTIMSSDEQVLSILKKLGINTDNLFDVDIQMAAQEPVILTTKKYVIDSDMDIDTHIISSEYTLVKKGHEDE